MLLAGKALDLLVRGGHDSRSESRSEREPTSKTLVRAQMVFASVILVLLSLVS